MKDLIECITTSETPLSIWFDEETLEVGVQYGYVVIGLPVEDFHDLTDAFAQARGQLPA